MRKAPAANRHVTMAVVVAALGYFVDIYDLILFSIVRVKSLVGIGIAQADLLDTGVFLINMQMGGMLLGGILWGILGDKRGRLSVLFGSIFLYSVANIANGFVTSVPVYAVLRFVAGVGLAGELGAGITLVAEVMHRNSRGIGTMVVAGVGILGAVVAVLVGDRFDWRTAYFVGGGLGIALLIFRIGVFESSMFESVRAQSNVARGDFFMLFRPRARALRYASIVLVAVPIWYAVGILVTFSPEIGLAMGMSPAPTAAGAVLWCYIGLATGDFLSGLLSQVLASRRRAIWVFLVLTVVAGLCYFTLGRISASWFYAGCALLGVANGYWAVFVTVASEQFGTNLRATATTTAPNFVRGAVVPLTLSFQFAKAYVGVVGSAIAVGVVITAVAFWALGNLDETFGKDLDYIDTHT